MKSLYSTVAIAALALALNLSPVQAGSSQGGSYGARLPIGVEFTDAPEKASTYRPAPAVKVQRDESFVPLGEGVVPQTSWNPFGTVVLTPEELAAQQAFNQRWRPESFRRAQGVGRWGDGVLPVEYAAQAWNGLLSGFQPNPAPAIGASID